MDKQAYENYIDTYCNMVYRIAVSQTKNMYDAEDVFQNTFFELYKHEKNFESDEHVKNWLVRVCINYAKDINKSFWKNKVDLTEDNYYESEQKNLHTDKLHEVLQKIRPEYRVVIYLFYYEEYSTKEIAELLKIKESNVRKRLERARKSIAKYIGEEW